MAKAEAVYYNKKTPGKPYATHLRLNKAMIELLAEGAYRGLSLKQQGDFAGVSPSTIHRWTSEGMRQQQDGRKGIYLDLIVTLEQAKAKRARESLERIRIAGQGGALVIKRKVTKTDKNGDVTVEETEERKDPDWKADAWYLERRHRQEFGQAVKAEVTGPGGGPLQVQTWVELMQAAEAEESDADDD